MLWHTLYVWLVTFFAWPNGSIWSNVVANPIIIGLAAVWSARKVIRHHQQKHEEHMAKLDEHMAKLEAIHDSVKSNGG